MKYPQLIALLAFTFFACKGPAPKSNANTQDSEKISFQNQLDSFVKSKQAKIGVAIIGPDGNEIFKVNNDENYTIMSVVKFPQALYVMHLIETGKLNKDSLATFYKSEIIRDTWSPYGDLYRENKNYKSSQMSIMKCFDYSVGESDNLVCDKLYDFGPIEDINDFFHTMGMNSFNITYKYKDMKKESLHLNKCSPYDMALMLRKFDQGEILKTAMKDSLYKVMLNTQTGLKRLRAGVNPEVNVAHKTGTFFDDSTNIKALNDVGLVQLENGKNYSIAVFVNDSKELPAGTEQIIAEINAMAYRYFNSKK